MPSTPCPEPVVVGDLLTILRCSRPLAMAKNSQADGAIRAYQKGKALCAPRLVSLIEG